MPEQPAARLLLDHLDLLMGLDRSFPVLDLACGKGRNGLALAGFGIPVVFADRSQQSLKVVEQKLGEGNLPGRVWEADLELPGVNPFSDKCFSAVLGFCYLHRPLFPFIKKAVIPRGLVVYESFTVEQQRFGRPHNPDFLLQSGELVAVFQDWEIIHQFEGILENPERCVAQIVVRKVLVL